MTESEIHNLAAMLHQIDYSVALEFAREIARLRNESDRDDYELKKLALENMRLRNDLKGAAKLLRQANAAMSRGDRPPSLRIAIESFVGNTAKATEIAEHLGIDPEEE